MRARAGQVLALLPQTQCTRCGYPNCAAYAQAVAQGAAEINQCPPGGTQGIEWLASITGQSVKPLNPTHGAEAPRSVAYIMEDWCIGCTLCINACPTDAILGSNKLMHTVIEEYCTGCELCLPVCPVDCIALENASGTATGWAAWSRPQAELARSRYTAASARRKREKNDNEKGLVEDAPFQPPDLRQPPDLDDPALLNQKRSVIESVLARARARGGSGHGAG